MEEWKALRRIAEGLCGWAHSADLDDIASEALLVRIQRGTSLYYCVISALRALYGKPNSFKNRLQRFGELRAEPEARKEEIGDADDLAHLLAKGSPAWVEDALRLIARGATLTEAAVSCNRSYQMLYTHLKR